MRNSGRGSKPSYTTVLHASTVVISLGLLHERHYYDALTVLGVSVVITVVSSAASAVADFIEGVSEKSEPPPGKGARKAPDGEDGGGSG
jgi:hypothetical protein